MNEFSITVTKDQLAQVGKAFAPFKKDDIRLSFAKSNLVFETSELAHTGRITLGNESVKDEYLDTAFFVSKGVLAKIEAVMQETATIKFTADDKGIWTAMSVAIKGNEINAGLPIFEELIDNAYTEQQSEGIDAERLANALKAVESAVIPQSETLACMQLSKELTFGSTKSICIVSNFLQNLTIKVSEDFRRHLANATKLGSQVLLVLAKDSRDRDCVVVKVENVEYKTPLAPHRLPDMSRLVQGQQFTAQVDTQTIQESIRCLSIPLMDADAELIIKLADNTLDLSIFDISGRYSGSKVPVTTSDTEGRVAVQIKSLASVLSPLEASAKLIAGTNSDNDVTVLVLEDSSKKIYLATNVE